MGEQEVRSLEELAVGHAEVREFEDVGDATSTTCSDETSTDEVHLPLRSSGIEDDHFSDIL